MLIHNIAMLEYLQKKMKKYHKYKINIENNQLQQLQVQKFQIQHKQNQLHKMVENNHNLLIK
jgi:hypothetical protein